MCLPQRLHSETLWHIAHQARRSRRTDGWPAASPAPATSSCFAHGSTSRHKVGVSSHTTTNPAVKAKHGGHIASHEATRNGQKVRAKTGSRRSFECHNWDEARTLLLWRASSCVSTACLCAHTLIYKQIYLCVYIYTYMNISIYIDRSQNSNWFSQIVVQEGTRAFAGN